VATVVASAGTIADPTGNAWQSHLIYDSVGSRWWLFYIESGATTSLKSAYSSDLVTWNSGATHTTPEAVQLSGRNIAVATKTISGTIVLWVTYGTTRASRTLYRVRGTISGTTLTWGTQAEVDVGYDAANEPCGPGICFSSDDKVYIANGPTAAGNAGMTRSTDADTGSAGPSAWTSAETVYTVPTGYCSAECPVPLASGAVLLMTEDASAADQTSYKQTKWSLFTGTWSAKADVQASALGAAIDPNNWGAVKVSNTDVHCVQRTDTNSYLHRRFDGTSWADGHAIPDQDSKVDSGIFLVTDGTNVWLVIIDSDAANTVRYCKWSGSSWGSWTALETSTKTRTYISGYPQVVSNTIGVLWSEVNGSNYDIVAASISTAAGGLYAGLVSYWKLDEASGTRNDSHGTNHLTDNNTVGAAAAKINDGADFERDNSEYLSIATNSDLETGDVSFSFQAWVSIESTGLNHILLAKNESGVSEEYRFYIDTSQKVVFQLRKADNSATVTVTGGTALSAGTLYHVVVVHDATANMMTLYLNGVVDGGPTAIAGGVRVSTNGFRLGRGSGAETAYLDGILDEVGFWKAALTADQVTWLRNGGSGRAYSTLGTYTAPGTVVPVFMNQYRQRRS
jgi:hypothetical protein